MASLQILDVGYVIHSRRYKENSLLVDFFTLNHGRISAIARSVKSLKSKSKALLQPYTPLELTLKQTRGSLFTLNECNAKSKSKEIKLPNIFCASYLNELLYYLFNIQDSCPKLFATYIESLERITQNDNVAKTLRIFEFTLLETLGYGIDFSDNEGFEIQDSLYYVYTQSDGFCKCDYNEFAYRGSILNAIARNDLSDISSLNLAKELCNKALKGLLGNKTIKSKILYQDYLKILGN